MCVYVSSWLVTMACYIRMLLLPCLAVHHFHPPGGVGGQYLGHTLAWPLADALGGPSCTGCLPGFMASEVSLGCLWECALW